MKAFITVIGHDTVGVVARVSGLCCELNINIEDVTQSILQGMFAMIMLVDISKVQNFDAVSDALTRKGEEIGVSIRIQREDIFNAMHRI